MPTVLKQLYLRWSLRKELVGLFKNLALMQKSGIPLNEALGILAEETRSSALGNFLKTAKGQIERGTPLSKIFKRNQDVVGELAVNIVRAGEINGTLEANLQYLAEINRRRRELRQKIQSAMLYPEIVLVMTLIIGGGISMFVLPKIVPLFTSLNVKLPLATQLLLALSFYIRDYGLWFFFAALMLATVLFFARRLGGIRWAFHTIALHLPFFGRLIRNYQLALFSQIFGTLFRSGMTIDEALVAAGNAMTNVRYKDVLLKAAKRLSSGAPLASILNRHQFLFPANAVAIIGIGEQSGKIEESFRYLAEYYENDVNVQTKRLPTLIEPLLLLTIGLVVTFVALAIISPIYEITSGIEPRN